MGGLHNGTLAAAALFTAWTSSCGAPWWSTTSCQPTGWNNYWDSRTGYYSPAICPSGYTSGCMRWDSNQGPALDTVTDTGTETETAVQCVPTGYSCDSASISHAVAPGKTPAPMIQVRWASSDLTRFQTHPLTPGLVMNSALATGAYSYPSGRPTSTATFAVENLLRLQNAALSRQLDQMKLAMGLVVGLGGAFLIATLLVTCLQYRRTKRRMSRAKLGSSIDDGASTQQTGQSVELDRVGQSEQGLVHFGAQETEGGDPPPYSRRT